MFFIKQTISKFFSLTADDISYKKGTKLSMSLVTDKNFSLV